MVLINPERPRRVREYRNTRQFAEAVAQTPNARVEVMIVVRNRRTESWVDLAEYWSGPVGPDVRMPTENELIAAGRSVGARFVKAVVRTKA